MNTVKKCFPVEPEAAVTKRASVTSAIIVQGQRTLFPDVGLTGQEKHDAWVVIQRSSNKE